MLQAKNVSLHFWAEALNRTCGIHNKISLRPGTTTTNYELQRGKKPNIRYFHIFASVSYILTNREHRKNWDSKSDERIFLGYSSNTKAYKVFNKRTRIVMESINVVVDDSQFEVVIMMRKKKINYCFHKMLIMSPCWEYCGSSDSEPKELKYFWKGLR